ncbi:sigma 54-interacting transcriptional regulator [Halodesulfovibrio marinisediminis]|uniref:DNA-binding transcriptional response regulator, NtrC family, contains REC, AAA-type ATPase, and a Fis-type DNA-binding domains n=1 Tax=Halodesulfovibrio marinisediminis DSM 17456 TaxID=1121457 RepID=A0A1N6I9Z8_9BACT|nr:sigma-54 dependent transcriptional regulator [Halodesulfovibrio marinisediminis]SIO28799.1 DNA-binding transcriptional response regulator, NtrC family, contains REC, AAA-type ATPase, and a Fis-type DNA-binding domains [Halodesulfovibrio marinisediminis DSM 17456]
MKQNNKHDEQALFGMLTKLCEEVAWQKKQQFSTGESQANTQEREEALNKLFMLTQQYEFPEHIQRLADAIGLLYVSLEISEMRHKELLTTLRQQNLELETALNNIASSSKSLSSIREGATQDFFVASSPIMQATTNTAYALAPYPINVMLLGSSGTGKEVFAKLIHNASPRKDKPFIAVNCTAIPDSLFESEMFGIDKGVATGVSKRTGFFVSANEGTLFLDEIGDMSLSNQSKLLRALESREITPVGKSRPIPIDIRIISATNCDLEKAVAEKRFREDLYYRLNVAELQLPDLSLRGEDIIELANILLAKHCRRFNRPTPQLSAKAKKLLLNYSWQGNVRELNNEMERAAALFTEKEIVPTNFSPRLQQQKSKHVLGVGTEEIVHCTTEKNEQRIEDEDFSLAAMEEITIKKALEYTQHNKSKAAKLLGITREGLRKKLQRIHIP